MSRNAYACCEMPITPSQFSNGLAEKRRVSRPRDKVVLRDKLIEFGRGQAVVPPFVEDDEVEDLQLAVVQVNRTGRGIVGHGLQQQNAFRHFKPARSHPLAEGDKDFHHVFDIGLLAQPNFLCCKQRFKTHCSSALRHHVFLLI